MISIQWAPIVTAGIAALVIAVWDFRSFRIPNFLTFPLLLTGIVYHSLSNGWLGFSGSVLGVLAGGGIVLVPYILGGIGAGDVKLLAAMGAWLQPYLILLIFGYSGILVGAFALWRLARKTTWQRAVMLQLRLVKSQLGSVSRCLVADQSVEEVVDRGDDRDRLIPFGVCFALGLFSWIAWQIIQLH